MRALVGGVLGLVIGSMGVASADQTVANQTVNIIPPAAHTSHLVKQRNGNFTLSERALQDPAWTGVATFDGSGLKTLADVNARTNLLHTNAIAMHPSSDCSAMGVGTYASLPTNLADSQVPSQSIVELPVTNFATGDYLAAASAATNDEQYRESCARSVDANP